MTRRAVHAARRAGLTLVELILALGLFALLMVAVFQLFDGSLSLWRRGEKEFALEIEFEGRIELLGAARRQGDGGPFAGFRICEDEPNAGNRITIVQP